MSLRWLAPTTSASVLSGHSADGTHVVPLQRRGVHHGYLLADRLRHPAFDLRARIPQAIATDFAAARSIVLRRVLARRIPGFRGEIRRTLKDFQHLREGALLEQKIARRIAHDRFHLAGVTVDVGDPREVEKVFVDARSASGRRIARDLFAKLAWIAFDTRDESLRLRFSNGHEVLQEWHQDPRLSVWADRFATAAFPECEVLGGDPELSGWLRRLYGRSVRLSERILYNNAPGGGAVFHHDAEPTQLGVLFGQLQGRTAWLALPRLQLARLVVDAGSRLRGRQQKPRTVRAAMKLLDDPDVLWVRRLLDHTPWFTGMVVAAGGACLLDASDVLLLPSHSVDEACWHSVFALGAEPSLALSFGVFAARMARARV